MSRNPNEGRAIDNPSVTGAHISGNARLRIGGRVVTTGGQNHSVTGISASGGSVVVLGDVVTTGNRTTVTGGISVRGTGRVEVGGRVIENGTDITDIITVVQRNPSVEQTQAQRFMGSPLPVVIYVECEGMIDFKGINENIELLSFKESAPECARIRFPKADELDILEKLRTHPRVISVNGERTPQGEVMMAAQTNALREMGL